MFLKLKGLRKVIFLISFWTVFILTAFYIGFSYSFFGSTSCLSFVNCFAHWDGQHFLDIALLGYSQKFQYAFFPLYPTLIHVFSFINSPTLAGILISFISISLGSVFFYKLIKLDFGKEIAFKSLLALLIFPTSFYFLSVYSEAIFFLFTILAFYFAKRKKFLLASIFAGLSSLSRFSGVATVIAIGFIILKSKDNHLKYLKLLILGSGFLLYFSFLYLKTGNPFYFLEAELHWQRSIALPWTGFLDTISSLTRANFIHDYPSAFYDLIFSMFGVGMVIRAFRFLKKEYAIFGLVSIIIPLLTPSLSSMPRFVLLIFPIFILLALIKSKTIFYSYVIASGVLLFIFASLFFQGYWVS